MYWHQTTRKSIEWKTEVESVERFEFKSLADVDRELKKRFGYFISEDYAKAFFKDKNRGGYCLAYIVKPTQRVRFLKPSDLNFPQMGWMSGENKEARIWLRK